MPQNDLGIERFRKLREMWKAGLADEAEKEFLAMHAAYRGSRQGMEHQLKKAAALTDLSSLLTIPMKKLVLRMRKEEPDPRCWPVWLLERIRTEDHHRAAARLLSFLLTPQLNDQ